MWGSLAWAAAVGLNLAPFGSLSELLAGKNLWTGYFAEDALLLVVRAERVPGSCEVWKAALREFGPGNRLGTIERADLEWSPWKETDTDALTECTSFPCKFKLDQREVEAMGQTEPLERKRKFLELVTARVRGYETAEKRPEYEFPGDPVEPWSWLAKRGFESAPKLPLKRELWVRKLDFSDGQHRVVRQILDRRSAERAHGASVWVRDVYTAHYFDGWGEWIDLDCSANPAILTQALLIELDLLKSRSIGAILTRGKAKDAVREQGLLYLEKARATLEALAASSVQPKTSAKSRPEIPRR